MAVRMQTCCFTGHRDLLSDFFMDYLAPELDIILRNLIARGVIDFMAGGALGFDTFAAQSVLKLREEFPHIRLVLALPCPEQTKRWQASDVAEYERIKAAADDVRYISPENSRGCMHKRNRYMVDHSGLCVAYCASYTGGTACTVDYAEKRMVPVIFLRGRRNL